MYKCDFKGAVHQIMSVVPVGKVAPSIMAMGVYDIPPFQIIATMTFCHSFSIL